MLQGRVSAALLLLMQDVGPCPALNSSNVVILLFLQDKWLELSGHYSRDWSEYMNMIGAISEPFAVNEDIE